ncbi:MAG: hypothetical protein Q9219_003487 [cf. Caloplaca sp. 3 TL-2023]
MHYSAFLYAATALCATSVSARCFQSGENWGDHGVAKGQLREACKGFAGNYYAGQPWTLYRNSPTESKCFVFEVQNEASHSRSLSQDYCESQNGREIDNCGHGGEEFINGWRFRGDPNSGKC